VERRWKGAGGSGFLSWHRMGERRLI
jgi:hypothetical protein